MTRGRKRDRPIGEDFAEYRRALCGFNDPRLVERAGVLEHFATTAADDSFFVRVCVPEWRALHRALVPGKVLTGEWKPSEQFTRVAAKLAGGLLARFAACRARRSALPATEDVMWACMAPFRDQREFAYALNAYIWLATRRASRADGSTAPIRRAYEATRSARESGADVGLCDEHLRDFVRMQPGDYLDGLTDVAVKAEKVAGSHRLYRGGVPRAEVARSIRDLILAGLFADLSVDGTSVDTVLNRPYDHPKSKDWVGEHAPGLPRPTTISTKGRYPRDEQKRKERRVAGLEAALNAPGDADAASVALEAREALACVDEALRARRKRAGDSRLRRIVLDHFHALLRGETDCARLAAQHRCDRSALWRCYEQERKALADDPRLRPYRSA